jgi:hypothetical protein
MAWTAPRTWVSGELVTAALFNTHIRDNLSALDGGRSAITSQAAGDVIYATSSTQLGRIAPSTSGNVLTSNGSIWTSAEATGNAYVGSVSGRLTLTSGTPVTTADVTGAATLYFTPHNGATIDLYTGSAWTQVTFAEMSIALSGGSASKPHDVFLDYNGGSPALAILAWTNDTSRATALASQNSVLVKTGDTQQRYLGTIYSDGSKQCADSFATRHCWNYYNRVSRPMRVVEPTVSWTYTTDTYRQARATATNQLDLVVGVLEDMIEIQIIAYGRSSIAGKDLFVSIGEDSTSSSITGVVGQYRAQASVNQTFQFIASFVGFSTAVGQHHYVWLERSEAAGTSTWYGVAGFGATMTQAGIYARVRG